MYEIHPIRCGTLTSNKDSLTLRTDRDVRIEFPVLAFLLKPIGDGSQPVVLVDTGVRSQEDAFIQRQGKIVGGPGGGPEPLLDGLGERGYRPSDIDILVMTHLHHDHVANVGLFEESTLIIQRAEYEAARRPLPIFRDTYTDDILDHLERLDIELIEGEKTLTDGITLVPTPGHTEGGQTLLVQTETQPHALISDLAYNQHNLQPELEEIPDANGDPVPCTSREMTYIPPGTVIDVAACYESIARVRQHLGDKGVLVPGHAGSVPERLPSDTQWYR